MCEKELKHYERKIITMLEEEYIKSLKTKTVINWFLWHFWYSSSAAKRKIFPEWGRSQDNGKDRLLLYYIIFFEIFIFKKEKSILRYCVSRRRRFYSQEKRGTAWKKMGGNGHYSRNFAWDVLRKKNIKIYFSFFLSPFVCSSCYAEFSCWAKCHEVKLCVSGYFFLLLVANWNSKWRWLV